MLFIGCVSLGACGSNALVGGDLGGPADSADLGAGDDLAPAGDLAAADLAVVHDLAPAPPDLTFPSLSIGIVSTLPSGTPIQIPVWVSPPTVTTVTLSLVAGPGPIGGTVTGTTNATGEAIVTPSFAAAGQYSITATAPAVQSAFRDFRVAGTPHWTVEPHDAAGGVVQSPAPTVTLIDGNGAVDDTSGDEVVVHTSSASTCPLAGADVHTAQGVATLSNLVVRTACTGYILTASTPWSNVDSTPFDISVGPPAQLAVQYLGAPATIPLVSTAFPVRVSIVDAGGNVAAAAPTVIDLSVSGAVLGGTTELTTAASIANFSNLTIDRAGSFTLNASGGGWSGSLALSVTAWDPRAAVDFPALTVDPTNPDVVYAFPGIGDPATIQASTDGAASFAARATIAYIGGNSPIVADAKTPSTLYVPSGFGFFRSDDSGASFAATAATGLTSELDDPQLVQDGTSGLFYLLDDQQMWRTSDGGASFSAITLPYFRIFTVAVQSATSTVWAGGDGQLWSSSDAGAHWTEHTGNLLLPPATAIALLLVSPTNPNNVYVGCGEFAMCGATTVDGGKTWTALAAGPNPNGIVVDAGGTWYAAGDDSGLLWKSADGVNWRSVPVPTNLALYPVPGHANWLYGVAAYSNRIYRTESGGE